MSVRIELSGPLFKKPVVAKSRRTAVNKIINRVTTVGKQNVTNQLTRGHGKDTGAFRRSVRKRTRKRVGLVFSTDPRVATWLEGTQARQRSGQVRFGGYGIFRRAAEETDRTARRDAERYIAEMAHSLGGR